MPPNNPPQPDGAMTKRQHRKLARMIRALKVKYEIAVKNALRNRVSQHVYGPKPKRTGEHTDPPAHELLANIYASEATRIRQEIHHLQQVKRNGGQQ